MPEARALTSKTREETDIGFIIFFVMNHHWSNEQWMLHNVTTVALVQHEVLKCNASNVKVIANERWISSHNVSRELFYQIQLYSVARTILGSGANSTFLTNACCFFAAVLLHFSITDA